MSGNPIVLNILPSASLFDVAPDERHLLYAKDILSSITWLLLPSLNSIAFTVVGNAPISVHS